MVLSIAQRANEAAQPVQEQDNRPQQQQQQQNHNSAWQKLKDKQAQEQQCDL